MRSRAYGEVFATEDRPKMCRRWDAKMGSCSCVAPKAATGRNPQHGKQEPDNRRQHPDATLQLQDLGLEIGLGRVEHVHADHGS